MNRLQYAHRTQPVTGPSWSGNCPAKSAQAQDKLLGVAADSENKYTNGNTGPCVLLAPTTGAAACLAIYDGVFDSFCQVASAGTRQACHADPAGSKHHNMRTQHHTRGGRSQSTTRLRVELLCLLSCWLISNQLLLHLPGLCTLRANQHYTTEVQLLAYSHIGACTPQIRSAIQASA